MNLNVGNGTVEREASVVEKFSMRIWILTLFIVTVAATTGCGGPDSAQSTGQSSNASTGVGGPLPPEIPNTPSNPTPTPPSNPTSPGIKFCSDLDFKNLTWSAGLPAVQRNQFALALNLSGSFEGHEGWSNLTGNFDGQGISMGLLNQPLGTGSLQPMWAEMRNLNPALMKTVMTAAHYDSMTAMLKTWGATIKTASALNIKDYGYNDLDEPEMVANEIGVNVEDLQAINIMATSGNAKSVTWAKQNALKSNGDIKTDWEKQLQTLANTADYRSIQVSKAEKIHREALDLFNYFAGSELRSYLFFFDIVVQNGGISTAVKTKYNTWLKSNKTASEKTRMLKILEYRLGTVRVQYVGDVKARKTSILNGKGTVHGSARDYEKEYCATLSSKI